VGKYSVKKGRDHLNNIGVDGWPIVLKEIGYESRDWIRLAKDRYRRPALVNTVMKLRYP
jgi:hypothetical protein